MFIPLIFARLSTRDPKFRPFASTLVTLADKDKVACCPTIILVPFV
jgi:hypothetical protein